NARVQMVREAQQRLADGAYGACQRCGRQISPERLEALPWAAYCIECQEIVDQEMDQTGLPPYPQLEPVENPRAGERKRASGRGTG
ncbi:MAG TPA: TraR/DksA C4-type zinc finger protein, partial [Thermomicrobiales bacterium]|nr:TraR/DksA C4-type zinc finger protein [Thermomicrobiales bacterium]